MRVSYGMPALAYADFERTGPVVRRVTQEQALAGYGYPGGAAIWGEMDEYGFVPAAAAAAAGVSAAATAIASRRATAKNLARLRRKLKKLQAKRRKAKTRFMRKRYANRIKRLKKQIAKLVKRAKKQIARRRRKGKKLSRRLKRLQASSIALRRAKARRGKGQTAIAPRWFMRGSPQSVRQNRWSQMSPKARRAAWVRFRKRQKAKARRAMIRQRRVKLTRDSLTFPEDGFTSRNAFDQGVSSTQGQDLVAMPDFEDADLTADPSEDTDIATTDEEFAEDIEESGPNKKLLWGGLLVAAGIGAFLVMRKKKPSNGGGKKRKAGRAR